MKKNKICFVNTHYIKNTIGGAEVQMYLLGKAFINIGWEVFYVSEDIKTHSQDEGINLVPFSNEKSFDYYSFCKILNEIDADIYYQRGRKVMTYYTGKYCKQYNKKFIFATSMDIDPYKYKFLPMLSLREPINLFVYFIPTIIKDCRSLKGIKMANVVLAQTEEQKDRYKKNIGIDSIIVKKIYPSNNIENIIKNEKPLILWVSNLKPIKQPNLFLKLVDDLNYLNCDFLMVGEIRNKKYLQLLTDYHNKYSNFKFIEGVKYSESSKLFNNASIFVNTSKSESEPNTYIESWLNKVPVVALNHDPDGIIKKNKMGFHSQTYDQLVLDVKKLIENSELRNEIGKRAREFAIDVYAKKNFEKLLTVINKII